MDFCLKAALFHDFIAKEQFVKEISPDISYVAKKGPLHESFCISVSMK